MKSTLSFILFILIMVTSCNHSSTSTIDSDNSTISDNLTNFLSKNTYVTQGYPTVTIDSISEISIDGLEDVTFPYSFHLSNEMRDNISLLSVEAERYRRLNNDLNRSAIEKNNKWLEFINRFVSLKTQILQAESPKPTYYHAFGSYNFYNHSGDNFDFILLIKSPSDVLSYNNVIDKSEYDILIKLIEIVNRHEINDYEGIYSEILKFRDSIE